MAYRGVVCPATYRLSTDPTVLVDVAQLTDKVRYSNRNDPKRQLREMSYKTFLALYSLCD